MESVKKSNSTVKKLKKDDCSINKLDDVCLREIFSYLNLDDLSQCSLVSKLWNQLADDAVRNYKHLTVKRADELNFKRILKRFSNLKSLKVKYCTGNIIKIIGDNCHKLEKLELFLETEISVEDLKFFAINCKRIKQLKIVGNNEFMDDDLFKILVKNLSKLEILELHLLNEFTGEHFNLFNRNLKGLKITSCLNIEEQGWRGLCDSNIDSKKFESLRVNKISTISLTQLTSRFNNLKSLEIIGIDYYANVLEIIGNFCEKLENFFITSFAHTTHFQESNWTFFANNCKNLKSLRVHHILISEKSLENVLETLSELEVLDIRINNYINGNCFKTFGRKLKSLVLKDCKAIEENAWRSLCESRIDTKVFEKLCIFNTNVSSDSLDRLTKKFSHLKELTICSEQSQESFTGFEYLSRLTEIQSLSIDKKFNHCIDEKFLIVFQSLSKLVKLNLDSLEDLTDESLSKISEYCPLLEKITIQQSNISDVTVEKFISLRKLRSLYISKCSNITDESIKKLMKQHRRLKILTVSCRNISDETDELIIKFNRNCYF